MKTNNFKPGDRVVYYAINGSMEFKRKGNVLRVIGPIVEVQEDDREFGGYSEVHYRQCVKLYTPDRGAWKLGKRVKVYGTTERLESDYQNGSPYCYRRGDLGTVVSSFLDHDCFYEVTVKLDKGGELTVHSMQLLLVD
jgi:hypothetical protein